MKSIKTVINKKTAPNNKATTRRVESYFYLGNLLMRKKLKQNILSLLQWGILYILVKISIITSKEIWFKESNFLAPSQ